MFEKDLANKILTFILPQEDARGPDSRLGPVPAYAFQGEKNSCVPELIIYFRKILVCLLFIPKYDKTRAQITISKSHLISSNLTAHSKFLTITE